MRTHTSIVLLSLLLACPLAAREWTDATGKFKTEADLVRVEGDRIVLKKPDGVIVILALDRLSPADQQYIRALTEPGAKPETIVPPSDQVSALAREVSQILRAACYRCHGQEGSNEGGLNYLLQTDKLARGRRYVVPGNPGESYLFKRISATDEELQMPPPGETRRLSKAEIDVIGRWIAAGAPAVTSEPERPWLSREQILSTIAADLDAMPERFRRFARYFTLAHLWNSGVSEDELSTFRVALAKLTNSLSWNRQLVLPKPIDPEQVLLRIDIRNLDWTEHTWNQLIVANPYKVQDQLPVARSVQKHTQCPEPLIRGDWFVVAASRPPLYHEILGIPKTDKELEKLLRLNVGVNIDQEQVVRAGFNRSGISQNNRLIERHETPYGGYWRSYDFAANVGRQSLLQHPLGPGDDAASFRHDGGEMIFALPNGLLGFMLADAKGQRIDKGPTEIVSDPRQPDRAVVTGISCMSCHYAGVIAKDDEVRPLVESRRSSYSNPDTILALYPKQSVLMEHFTRDAERYLAALKELGLKRVTKTSEPISNMAERYRDELDARAVAAELGIPVGELMERLDKIATAPPTLAALRVPGGIVKRDAFAQIFADAATALSPSSTTSKTRAPEKSIFLKTDQAKVLCFSNDGLRLVIGTFGGKHVMFDAASGAELATFPQLEQQVDAMAFTRNDEELLSGHQSGNLIRWNPARPTAPVQTLKGHTSSISCISVSPDGSSCATGSDDRTVRIWDLGTSNTLHQLEGFEGKVLAVQLLRDGSCVATDGKIIRRTSRTGKSNRQLRLESKFSHGAALSSDGSHLVLAEPTGSRLFNANTGVELPKLPMTPSDSHYSLTFSREDDHLIVGGSGRVTIINLARRRITEQFATDQNSPVQVLVLSPDGRRIAFTGNAGVTIRRIQ